MSIILEEVPNYSDINSGRATWNKNFKLVENELNSLGEIVNSANSSLVGLKNITLEDTTTASGNINLNSTNSTIETDTLSVRKDLTVVKKFMLEGYNTKDTNPNSFQVVNGRCEFGDAGVRDSVTLKSHGNLTMGPFATFITENINRHNIFTDTAEINLMAGVHNAYYPLTINENIIIINLSNYTDTYPVAIKLMKPSVIGLQTTIIFNRDEDILNFKVLNENISNISSNIQILNNTVVKLISLDTDSWFLL